MPDQAAAPRPDVTDMYAVHGVFRDTLGSTPRLVGNCAPGDAEGVALIVNYYENILSFLDSNHDAEEKLVFDCYHIMSHLGKAVDTVRKQKNRALAAEGDKSLA